MAKPIRIALAGNPNSGKTTVFNALTGAHQHVGNYPGVTVEKKEGSCRWDGRSFHVVDLPGTYSLTADSLEELVARNFLIEDQPDVVVDIVDASNLERNLYLTTQLIELGIPVVVALNMADVVESKGRQIDDALLARLLGVPTVRTAASRGRGIAELMHAVAEVADRGQTPTVQLHYGEELEAHIDEIAEAVTASGRNGRLSPRWIAVKLLEGDQQVVDEILGQSPNGLREMVESASVHIRQIVGDDPEIAIADRRYGFISGACREAVVNEQQGRLDWSETIDQVMLSRVFGVPIFLGLMWLMFTLVFRLGAPPMQWLESAFAWLGQAVAGVMPDGPLQSLVVDGIIGGVGGVLVFVPNIILLFVALALFEDSGYMARAAFVIDRVMHKIGLHGKSFIPLLVGFGCTVPAVLATRTLASTRDRIVTILVAPLMSCGARLPVYILLAGAFFPAHITGHVIFSIYLLGVLMAVTMAKLFRSTIFCGPNAPFVMELPPYRVPTVRGVMIHTFERAWQYVRKAGTVILAVSVVMWYLMSSPALPPQIAETLPEEEAAAESLSHSFAGRMGQAVAPALEPLGFNWKVGIALIAGVTAKEVVVATLGTAYSLGSDDAGSEALQRALRQDPDLSPLVAYTLMVFVLLYMPCLASMVVIGRETGSWRWAAFAAVYTCALAWIVALIVYQGGRLLGLG